jgi:hypothetical protein
MYQSLIGALQWAITLGRFDLLPAVVACVASEWHPALDTWIVYSASTDNSGTTQMGLFASARRSQGMKIDTRSQIHLGSTLSMDPVMRNFPMTCPRLWEYRYTLLLM